MQTEMMSTPDSREEFERNLFLLRERITQGKLHIMRGVGVDGLLRVRKLPNGRIDLLSIDEMTRLQANMCAQMIRKGSDGAEEPRSSDETETHHESANPDNRPK